jgi:membrane-associated phospholipid phosphatase
MTKDKTKTPKVKSLKAKFIHSKIIKAQTSKTKAVPSTMSRKLSANADNTLEELTSFERLFQSMVKPRTMLLMMVFIVFLYFFLDKPIAFFVYTRQWLVKYPIVDLLTNIGVGFFYMFSLAIAACLFRFVIHNPPWEHRAWFLWLSVLVPNLVCLVMKILLGRARPEMLISSDLYGFYGFQKTALYWSFPSGHTTTIMGFMLGCGALFPKYLWRFVVFGLFISALRVVLLKHYLSDVIAATYLSLIEVGLLYHWLKGYVFDSKKTGGAH